MKAEELVASRSLREAGYAWRVACGAQDTGNAAV